MAEKRDYYEVLGVDRRAGEEDIKKAYRQLARQYHPDVTKEDPKMAEERFKEISEAYEVLMDPEKKQLYDKYGHAGVNSQFQGGGFNWSDFTHQSDLRDIFGDMGFGGSIFDMFFGGGRTRGPHQGQSLRYDLDITLEEAAEGLNKKITLPLTVKCEACGGTGSKSGKEEVCPQCRGTGQVQKVERRGYSQFISIGPCPHCKGTGKDIKDPCPECDGEGWVRKRKTISLDIPKGADTGMRLRVKGAGEPSPDGGQPGDLFVVVNVRPHKLFQREGADLKMVKEISFPEAALGATIEVPTLDKKTAELKVPPGTQPGEVFKLKGLGMPRIDGRGQGDLLVHLKLVVPKRLSAEQKELLRRFEGSDTGKKGLFGRGKG
ncbi:MAG: molecular chaperone DnaJ [Methanomassiliicoccales archaeon]|nr:molecular chaperone DnaJ [Methanomassiliicoccales archaeon]